MPKRIVMWSPPRARSTLMMRVFEALGCAVLDEPFYACWLAALNKTDDPGFAETLAAHPTEPAEVIEQVLGDVPGEREWYYQKHMAIHMLPSIDLGWMAHPEVINCFLIRDPTEVIVSMTEFRDLATLSESGEVERAAELVGIPQLLRIYEAACRVADAPPPVLDANAVLQNPVATLAAFSERIGLPFKSDQPIKWAPGQHADDGAWAPFWYQKVFATTRLGTYQAPEVSVPAALQPVVDRCMPVYAQLRSDALDANR